jgi:putative IMPACT (imprinted ancient) family translation regulator
MILLGKSKIKVENSKFFGYFFEIENKLEIEKCLEKVKNFHKKFTHCCYAFQIKKEFSFKNDGEVGNPGKILLDILEKNNFEKNLLIVIRIFGGKKLGPARVGKAFRESANQAIDF